MHDPEGYAIRAALRLLDLERHIVQAETQPRATAGRGASNHPHAVHLGALLWLCCSCLWDHAEPTSVPRHPPVASTVATPLQGEVMLRDGHYVSERDVMMKLQGVYVEASSRLHAVLEPAQPKSMHLEAHDAQEHSSDYRSASA